MGAGFAPDRNKCPGLSPARAWRRCAAEGEERVAGSWGDVRPAPPYCQRLRSVSGSRVAARPVARELTRDAARARCPIQRPAQEIGRAQVRTTVNNAHLGCRLQHEYKKYQTHTHKQ